MNAIDPTHDPRVAGQIERYHTWPRLHRQTVAEHSWQVQRILLTVWPSAPRRLLVHCFAHDMGEMAGDIAYPFKRNNPALKAEMDRIEEGVVARMSEEWCMPRTEELQPLERRVFKVCENLEMWEYGLQEVSRGNLYGQVVANRMLLAASAALCEIDNPSMVERVKFYVERRKQQENVT